MVRSDPSPSTSRYCVQNTVDSNVNRRSREYSRPVCGGTYRSIGIRVPFFLTRPRFLTDRGDGV